MAKARFNIKSRAEGEQLIYLVFRFRNDKFKYSTGQKIEAKYWNTKECRAREIRQSPSYRTLNPFLTTMARLVDDAYRNLLRESAEEGRAVSNEKVKAVLRDVCDTFLQKEKTERLTLLDFIAQFIDERSKLPEFTEGTVTVYKTTYQHLKAFNQQWHRRLDFDTIDLEFAYDFREWLYAPPREFSRNYVHKLIQQLKVFLNEGLDRELHDNQKFKSKRFQISKEEVANIYLTVKELHELYHTDPGLPSLRNVRDTFLVGAFTGLRFGDLTSLTEENFIDIDGFEVIRITTQKTKKTVTIPVHPLVRTIIDQYGGKIPKPISNQKFNKYLKELCRAAPWGNQEVIIARSKGGRRVREVLSKADLVKSHTARRSFATNAYKAGVPSITIMAITGHQSETEFLKYIKVSGEEHAKIIEASEFFDVKLLRLVND